MACLPPGFIMDRLDLELSIKEPRKMLTSHKLSFHITNKTRSIIEKAPNYVITDVPKTLDQLKLKAFDQNGNSLEIAAYPLYAEGSTRKIRNRSFDFNDDFFFKYFEIKFAEPLEIENSISYYLVYECEEPERFYSFYFPSDRIKVTIDYPRNSAVLPPFAFDGDAYEGGGRKISLKQFTIEETRNGRNFARYSFRPTSFGHCVTFRW